MSVLFPTVAILGVGLIGGSLGMAVRRKGLAERVLGIGRSSHTLDLAKRRGAIDEAFTDTIAGVAEADFVVVCTPVERIVDDVCDVATSAATGTLITDAGSTKASIVDQVAHRLPGAHFVGSHPIAGSDKSGVAHASAELFDGRVCVVTPHQESRKDDVVQVTRFWEALGMQVVSMEPEAHDQALGFTSHVPHVIAAALAGSLPSEFVPLTGSGFRDTTRVAAGLPDLWRQILLDNRQAVLAGLDGFLQHLTQLRDAIDQADGPRIASILEQAKQSRDALGS